MAACQPVYNLDIIPSHIIIYLDGEQISPSQISISCGFRLLEVESGIIILQLKNDLVER